MGVSGADEAGNSHKALGVSFEVPINKVFSHYAFDSLPKPWFFLASAEKELPVWLTTSSGDRWWCNI